jgi:ubiquinone/menaquinone biosynthesis C-methylase UbiE
MGMSNHPDEYIRKLTEAEPLQKPVMQEAIRLLDLPSGSSGLDVGCGVGLQAILLAHAVGEDGRVTGLDISERCIARARLLAEENGLENRIRFIHGDFYRIPFPENQFDWVWSSSCAGYVPGSTAPFLREFKRVTRSGALIALLAMTSQQLLPGYPALEARLNATSVGIAPFTEATPPPRHFSRALGWLIKAGFLERQIFTLTHTFRAPLTQEMRKALELLFDMRWGGAQSELGPEDAAQFLKLCSPESPECILNIPEYYAFCTYTMVTARVP